MASYRSSLMNTPQAKKSIIKKPSTSPTDRLGYGNLEPYLHRAYLDKNPRLRRLASSGAVKMRGVYKDINKLAAEFEKLENEQITLMSNIMFGEGTGSDKNALQELEKIFSAIQFAPTQLYDEFRRKSGKKSTATRKKYAEDLLLSTLTAIFENNKNISTERIQQLNKIYKQHIDNLKTIPSASKKRNKKTMAGAAAGTLSEIFIGLTLLLSLESKMKKAGIKTNKDVYKMLDPTSSLTGLIPALRSGKTDIRLYQDFILPIETDSVSETIGFSFKTLFNETPKIEILTDKSLGDLLNALIGKSIITQVEKDVINEAILNQTYWGAGSPDSDYHNQVLKILANRNDRNGIVLIDPTSAKSNAIETLSIPETIPLLRPVTERLYELLIYDLISGFQSMPNIFTIVFTPNGVRLLRTSAILYKISDDIKTGKLKKEKSLKMSSLNKPKDNLSGILAESKSMSRNDWWNKTVRSNDQLKNIVNHTRIKTSLNFGGIVDSMKTGF